MKKIVYLLSLFIFLFKDAAHAQLPNFSITPQYQCTMQSVNTATASYITNVPGASTYSWVITSPVGASATFTALPAGSPTATPTWSTINMTLMGYGTFTVASFAFSSSNVLALTIVQLVVVTAAPPATVNIINPAANTTLCPNTSVTLTAYGASTYTWYAYTISTGSSVVVTPTVNACYQVVGTYSTGCISNSNTCVQITPAPTVTVSGNNFICSGKSATLNVTGANSYSWSTGDITPSAIVSPTSNTTYTATGTSICGSDTKTIHVVVLPSPSLNITPSQSLVCKGSAITLTTSGANTYTWNTSSNGPSITVSPSVSTTYSVSGTNLTNNCTSTSSITIPVFLNPIITASASPVICAGTQVTLSASGSNTYSWLPISSNNSFVVVSPSITTSYTVFGYSTEGCKGSATVAQNVMMCTGLQTTQFEKLKLYALPNPSQGVFMLQLPSSFILTPIEVYNCLGQKIIKQILQTERSSIDLSDQPTGIYYLKFLNSGNEQILKLMVEK